MRRLRRSAMCPYEWDLRRAPQPYRASPSFGEGIVVGIALSVASLLLWWAAVNW